MLNPPQSTTVHLDYRSEIDGLRAVAVLPVIFFHAGFSYFRGGYVGVDVFFVISGYLITSLIVSEKASGTFTIANFYERRARRILPALFVVIAACLLPAWLFMTPSQLKEFFQSVAAVSVFSSNVQFFRLTSEYFASAAQNSPLLHTWSLGVEEQYYVFFPLLVLPLWSVDRHRLLLWLAALLIASLALCEYISRIDPMAAFFLAPWRAWELMIGALVVVAGTQKGSLLLRVDSHAREILAALGLLLIFLSVFAFGVETRFPGLYALVPTIGTALVIAFGTSGTSVARLLSLRLVVGIGLVSYSAYLWHQPLLAFARLWSFSQLSTAQCWVLIAVTFGLAYLTWRLIERPFRNRSAFSRAQIFTGAAIASIGFFAIGMAGHLANGYPSRFDPTTLAAIEVSRSATIDCNTVSLPVDDAIERCDIGRKDTEPSLVLLGDSHADAIGGVLGGRLADLGRSGMVLRNWACGPIPGLYRRQDIRRSGVARCAKGEERLLSFIRQSSSIHDVVVSIRWTVGLYPVPGEIEQLAYDNGEGGVYDDLPYRERYAVKPDGTLSAEAAAKRKAVQDFLAALKATGKHIVIVYPVPEVGWNVPQLAMKRLIRGQPLETVSTSYSHFLQRNRFAIDILDHSSSGMDRVRPSDALCDTRIPGRCIAQIDNVPFYFDDDHLSNVGAELVVQKIVERLR